MNDFSQMIFDRIAGWSKEAQAELVDAIVEIEAKHFGVYHLSDDERAAVREGLAQAARGDFVPDEELATFFSRFRS